MQQQQKKKSKDISNVIKAREKEKEKRAGAPAVFRASGGNAAAGPGAISGSDAGAIVAAWAVFLLGCFAPLFLFDLFPLLL